MNGKSIIVAMLITIIFNSGSRAAENKSDQNGATTSRIEVESEGVEPRGNETAKAPRYSVSYDKVFYEFRGIRAANQYGPNGVSAYGFDRVTYDTNSLKMTYSQSPTLQYSLSSGYNTIYAETKVYGQLSTDETRGISDTTAKVTKSFFNAAGISILEAGAIFPTGSIQEKNSSSPAVGDNYPYNMQLGSGTQDFQVSAMFIKPLELHQLGAFSMATMRTGRNSQGYRKGDEFMAKAWYSYNWKPIFTPGVWINYMNIQGVRGKDRTLDYPVVDQLLRFYYNSRSFWDVTANASSQYPLFKNTKLKALIGLPLFQHGKNVDDIQLYTQWFAQLGVEGQF